MGGREGGGADADAGGRDDSCCSLPTGEFTSSPLPFPPPPPSLSPSPSSRTSDLGKIMGSGNNQGKSMQQQILKQLTLQNNTINGSGSTDSTLTTEEYFQ